MHEPATPKRFQFSLGNLLIVTLALAAFLAGRASREGEVNQLSTAAKVAELRLAALQIKKPKLTVLTTARNALFLSKGGVVVDEFKSESDFKIERGMKSDAMDRKIRLETSPNSSEELFFTPVD